MLKINIVFLLLLIILLTSCGVFYYEPFVDATTDSNGNSVLLDTPRMWADFKWSVDDDIKREIIGEHASGWQTWNERWLSSIKHMQGGHQQNPQKYINYIIESRRVAGLPELVGYP